MRVLDLDPFEPVGINEDTMRFIDLFASFCLLERSPLVEACDQIAAKQNLRQAVYNGRDTSVQLCRAGRQTSLRQWSEELLDNLEGLAELYDQAEGSTRYRDSLALQRCKIRDPAQTTSAKVLAIMAQEKLGFFDFALRQAERHREQFLQRPLEPAGQKLFADMAGKSLAEQAAREAESQQPFAAFLADYFRD